jgi:hypothetical protein
LQFSKCLVKCTFSKLENAVKLRVETGKVGGIPIKFLKLKMSK